MKSSVVIALGLVATTQGFAPVSQGRVNTDLSATFFDTIFGMDLFAPKKDQNEYGARNKKNIVTGKITSKSYIPDGLTADQYNNLRSSAVSKKKANYEKNVKKAGIFEDYTEFYIKRGTDTKQDWAKDVTKGHRMAKTKYDWDKLSDKPLWAKTATEKKAAAEKKKAAPVKKVRKLF